MKDTEITAAELSDRLNRHDALNLLDVRQALEFHSFNIGGIHIPLDELAGRIEELEEYKEKELIVICQRGLRSYTAQSLLHQEGFFYVRNLKGGLLALKKG